MGLCLQKDELSLLATLLALISLQDCSLRIFILVSGDCPKVSNGSHLFLPVQRNGSSSTNYGLQTGGQWSARFLDCDDSKCLKISMTSPFTSAVGQYKIYFQVCNISILTKLVPILFSSKCKHCQCSSLISKFG